MYFESLVWDRHKNLFPLQCHTNVLQVTAFHEIVTKLLLRHIQQAGHTNHTFLLIYVTLKVMLGDTHTHTQTDRYPVYQNKHTDFCFMSLVSLFVFSHLVFFRWDGIHWTTNKQGKKKKKWFCNMVWFVRESILRQTLMFSWPLANNF